jgi:YD repeat-containing protein
VRLNGNAFSADLGYEADDDLSSIAHTGPAPLTFTLGRNASSQLTSLAASDGAYLARPASTLTEAYTANRLNQYSSVAGSTQTHDLNGNLTSDGTYTFTFDEKNRLRTASGAGNTSSYEYDPAGRRRTKVVNGATTRYASEGAEEIEERDGSQVVLRKYVYGSAIDDRVAMLDASACAGGGRCFFLTNWQGSTTTLINQNGTLNAVYHYGPYGEGTNWTPVDALSGNPFRYTGRRVDPETGLYYHRA